MVSAGRGLGQFFPLGHAAAAQRSLRHDLQTPGFDGLAADLAEAVRAVFQALQGLLDGLQLLALGSQEGEAGFGHQANRGLVFLIPGGGQHLLVTVADAALELVLDLQPEVLLAFQQAILYLRQSLGGQSCHPWSLQRIGWRGRYGRPAPWGYSRKSSSAALRVGCFKRFKAFFSIWRMRSRETLKALPISSKVCSTSSPMPKRIFMIFSSRAVRVVRMDPVFSPNWESRMAS